MVFVTLGNQNFQFNRLLRVLETLIAEGTIDKKVLVQTGHTSYRSEMFETIDFLTKEEFDHCVDKADYVISHAGTGSIINCLKKGKKVIVAARLSKYGEHIDDHQKEILYAFTKKNLIIGLDLELEDFKHKIDNLNKVKLRKFVSNNINFNKELLTILDRL